MPQQVTRRAYAKINLALAVGPPLPQDHPKAGFHPIASWMSCIDLSDEVTFTMLPGDRDSEYRIRWAADAPRTTPIDWAPEKDLAVRAHRELEHHARRPLPVSMDLAKRIPVGGGLGGGSSDAAAALLALNELFELRLDHEQLSEIGGRLGSDVGFFLDTAQPPRPSLVQGLGDQVSRLTRLDAGVVVLIPPFGCPTPAVYKAFDFHPAPPLEEQEVRSLIENLPDGRVERSCLFNALEWAAVQIEPRLARLSTEIRERTALPVHLSGSGSCLFVLCAADAVTSTADQIRRTLDAAPSVPDAPADWLKDVVLVLTRLV